MGTVAQQKWITKLIGYDFIMEYKNGKENKVADALSRQHESNNIEGSLAVITFPTPIWIEELKVTYN